MNYVYFIQSQIDGSYYVGSTRDLRTRFKEHNNGRTKSIKAKRPYILVYYEAYKTYTQARKREILIKKSWSVKEEIINRLRTPLTQRGDHPVEEDIL